MNPCTECGCNLTPSETVSHWHRFHFLTSDSFLFNCTDCAISDREFSDALVHGLLHGHGIRNEDKSLRQLPRAFYAQATDSSEIANPDQHESPTTCSQPVRDSISRNRRKKYESAVIVQQQSDFLLPDLTSINEPVYQATRQIQPEISNTVDDQLDRKCEQLSWNSIPSSYQNSLENLTRANAVASETVSTVENMTPSFQVHSNYIGNKEESGPETTTTAPNTKTTCCQKCSAIINVTYPAHALEHATGCMQVTLSSESPPVPSIQETKHAVCEKCGVSMSRIFPEEAARHVTACFRIKPYGCSACGVAYTKRSNVRRHFKRSPCNDARIVLLEKEQNEERIRDGLRHCFPAINFAWKGL